MGVNTYRVQWTIPGGGQGLTQFAFAGLAGTTQSDRQTAADAVRALYNDRKGDFPANTSWDFAAEFADLDPATFEPSDYHAVTAPLPVTSTGAGTYAGGVGARIDWLTSSVVNSRRVRGHTFMVPLLSAAYDATGTLSGTTITNWSAAANTLRTALAGGNMALGVVSHRWKVWSVCTSVKVPDQVAVLASRRF